MLFISQNRYFIAFCLFFYLLPGCKQDSTRPGTIDGSTLSPLFRLLPPEVTMIDFENTLQEGLNTNILMYEYFYNGGGVATGDLNQDGLEDIYFTSNMGENKLYLNKGNMRFADVTAKAGVAGRTGPWKTGVTLVDINGDRRLDLYISYSGALPDEKRINQLFLNQGNDENQIPRFSENAVQFGLASAAFSNQAYFFDYDRDQDLDMILLNHNPKNLPVLNEESTAELQQQNDFLRSSRLYRQTNGYFEDVTLEAGLSGSPLSYGLGIGIADLNQDGWQDFYVSNDYAVPDYLYINQGNGSFSNNLPESMGHTSHFSMGNDIGDINNDGLPDIVTLDMLPEDNRRQKLLLAPDNYAKFDLHVRCGFYYQYMRNMLQLNNGNGTFSEIGQLAGISNTDWSWAALLADYDNDGWQDLYVTNGYHRDYTNLDFINYMEQYVKTKGRLQREDVLEIIEKMPSSEVINYAFANSGDLHFANRTQAWGLNQPSNSNGAAYSDLDNDGDLDLVVNNINDKAFIYQNESKRLTGNHFLKISLFGEGLNTQGLGARITITGNGQSQIKDQYLSRGYLSAVSPVIHFGLGNTSRLDSLCIVWAGGKKQTLYQVKSDQSITLYEKDARESWIKQNDTRSVFIKSTSPIDYTHPLVQFHDFDRQPLLISEPSHSGPIMVKGDLNQDHLEDIFIGGGVGREAEIYFQQKNKSFLKKSISAFEKDKAFEDAAAALFDANGDGATDIYVASGGYHHFSHDDSRLQDRLYINQGNGNFVKRPDAIPELLSSKSCIAVNDINQDGHPDLFIGGRVIPGRYPQAASSFILINDGKGKFKDQTDRIAPSLQSFGMVTDAVWYDIQADGMKELIVVGEWLPITIFSMESGKMVNHTGDYFTEEYKGWWNKLAVGDFNKDGRPDMIIGNMGTNTQFQASEQKPVEIYFKDFDQNGSIDPLLCFYIQGKSYPYVTREELLRQISAYRSRYTSYNSFADLTIRDIFNAGELSDAGHLQVNQLKTSFFTLKADGKFELRELPVQVQFSPVYTITPLDFNKDGYDDLLLCGNNSHAKLRLGRFDANYGALLQGSPEGKFKYIESPHSGLNLRGDVRSVIALGEALLFGIHEGPLVTYRVNEQ